MKRFSSTLSRGALRRLQTTSRFPVTTRHSFVPLCNFPTSAAATDKPIAPSRTFASLAAAATAATMDAADLKHYLADSPPTIVRLEIEKHFEALTDQQKRYAHFISRAAFAGTRIVLRQVSPESEAIYDFILAVHKGSNGDWKAIQSKAGISDEELGYFLQYAGQFLGNNGNYKSFGDAKFIPRGSEAAFKALAATNAEAEKAYKATNGAIFSHDSASLMHLGYPEQGHMTTYYPESPAITKDEIDAVSSWMEKKGLLPENTRLSKSRSSDFEIKIASASTSVPSEGGDIGKEVSYSVEDGPLAGKTIKLAYGDYAKEMAAITENIKKAAENGANETQQNMYNAYAKSFEGGSLLAFKDSQRYWIRDKGPAVESNIGFIETYRDPAGVRGEWEGFAAVVNLERTKAFGNLVTAAPELIPKLPWSKEFEKDKFLAPDFTSLEVLTFAGSGIPAGINIPNYDDIRQTEGFKNVSLGNVLSAKAPNEKIPFIADKDLDIYRKYRDEAFEVQVGLHELTGHGCGKLLQETSPGEFNFDKSKPPVSPITNKPVSSWYKPGQTWGSVFGSVAGAYEECRAELVAMFLSCDFPTLQIFGFGDGTENMDSEAGDLLYASYLSMARAGLASLEMWDPKSRKWGQPHSQARFSILQCFLQAGDDFCKLDYQGDNVEGLTINLDRSKILTVGRQAVGEYLQKLHVYKSTADVEAGSSFFLGMTNVDPEFWGQKVRSEVLRVKQPRKVYVQANTYLDESTGKVSVKHYEATLEGLVQSWADRDV